MAPVAVEEVLEAVVVVVVADNVDVYPPSQYPLYQFTSNCWSEALVQVVHSAPLDFRLVR